MNARHLIIRNIAAYTSFYRLIAIAVVVAVTVITGSLAVGDSVRGTLIKRVEERMGKTQTVIFSRYSYMDSSLLTKIDGKGMLLSNGFVSVSGKLTPVMVWGRDDLGIKRGEAKINRALYQEINTSAGAPVVLRLPAAGMVPLGSMFVTDTYTTSLRISIDEVIGVAEGGNISLKNEQTIPFNVFVHRDELAQALNVSGKINLILSDRMLSTGDFAAAWDWASSGLHIKTTDEGTEITSDRIFIQDSVVETLCQNDPASNRIFAYLANSISNDARAIPYSFIAAADAFQGQPVQPDEIILSDYAAKRLHARLHDTLSVGYFVSRSFKTLLVDTVFLKVGKIVPLSDLAADHRLRAPFPGLSNVERCTDWNSDLPIDMSLITDEDETFWHMYRNTPKAVVSYATLAPRWKNGFGSATALQINNTNRLSDLTYEMFDIQVRYPREAGLTAAKSGVDFSMLFLSLGFFILLSAALLMTVPLSEMLFRRRDEIRLLHATGFPKKRMTMMLLRESTPIVLLSALAGVVAGVAYTCLVLFLLGTVWQGATHTDGFRVYPHLSTLGTGLLSGVVLALVLLYVCTVRAFRLRPTSGGRGSRSGRRRLVPLHTPRLVWAFIGYGKYRAVLSFVSLASGVLVLFLVGLNRQGFADTSKIRSATGGFSLWCETSVPVYHNMGTEEGRAKLGLNDLPKSVRTLQGLTYSADDASCLNLNKVVMPNVLGVDMEELEPHDFIIFDGFAQDSLYPAWVDETVLTWSLGKKWGDTLVYTGDNGKKASLQLVGTMNNPIFQGYLLVDKTSFTKIWPQISGSEIVLVKAPDEKVADVKTLISQALNNYGVRVTTTGERLQMFYSVMDTYLTIFLTLGGLGLLLGIFSFIIVVRKNIAGRLYEVSLYRALGFSNSRIARLLYQENLVVPLCAISTGALGALLGGRTGLGNVDARVWMLSGLFLMLFILCISVCIKTILKNHLRQR